MITVCGEAYGRSYNYKCDLVSRTKEEAVFKTKSKPRHIIKIRPRYTGSCIGSRDCDHNGKPTTICAFFFNEEYVALALFIEDGKNIEIIPHEH